MNILLCFPGFIIAFAAVLFYEHKIKLIKTRLIKTRLISKEHNKNNIHFYVARDKDGTLWLYFNKPFRGNGGFFGGVINVPLSLHRINRLGLNKVACANIKWEDEPVEVFINVED